MTRRRGIFMWSSGAIALAAGVLMVASGYSSGGILLAALGVAESDVPRYVSGLGGASVYYSLMAVAGLVALGGVTVSLGGLLILAGRRTTGRLLIMLGGGSGLLGLLITFGYAAIRLGLFQALSLAQYWLGLVLAAVARRIAREA